MSKCSFCALAITAALAANAAMAADLPSRKEAPVFIPPAPIFGWSGLYAGLNLGYGFGAGGSSTGAELSHGALIPIGPIVIPLAGQSGIGWSLPTNLKGIQGGIQAGGNYQVNSWFVLGAETDFQFANLTSNSTASIAGGSTLIPNLPPLLNTAVIGTPSVRQQVEWWGTLRARAGVTAFAPNLLLYGTAGLAYGNVKTRFGYLGTLNSNLLGVIPLINASATGLATNSDIKFGWTAGAGLEWAPMSMPNLSFKVEYLYTDLGKTVLTAQGVGAASILGGLFTIPANNSSTNTSYTRFQTVRVGMNYRFNTATTPVVAKY